MTERGCYCTGGQTCGEIWTPPGELAARLGDKNQEHCTVYNMMRLADYLFRWTGDVELRRLHGSATSTTASSPSSTRRPA